MKSDNEAGRNAPWRARARAWFGRDQRSRGVTGLEYALAAAFALCAVAAGTSALAAVLGAILG
jgi:Flp pilus assembly pilin Flp